MRFLVGCSTSDLGCSITMWKSQVENMVVSRLRLTPPAFRQHGLGHEIPFLCHATLGRVVEEEVDVALSGGDFGYRIT